MRPEDAPEKARICANVVEPMMIISIIADTISVPRMALASAAKVSLP